MNDLKTQWKIFIRILLSPIVSMTLIFTIGAICLASNTAMTIIFSAIASISAGILGGIVWEKYREINGNSEFLKKGKSAVRNLVLIDNQLNRLRNHLIGMDHHDAVLSANDIDHHLLTTEKSVISAIEDWVDMMPDLRKQAELAQSLSEESEKYKKLMNDKAELEKKLTKKGVNEKEFENKIKQKDEELSKVHAEISHLKAQQLTIAEPVLSNTSTLSLLDRPSPLTIGNLGRICERCGESYEPSSVLAFNMCRDCMNRNTLY